MPIRTELTGEQAKALINKEGISRMCYNDSSCFLFLEPTRAIEIIGTVNADILYTEVIYLPEESKPD